MFPRPGGCEWETQASPWKSEGPTCSRPFSPAARGSNPVLGASSPCPHVWASLCTGPLCVRPAVLWPEGLPTQHTDPRDPPKTGSAPLVTQVGDNTAPELVDDDGPATCPLAVLQLSRSHRQSHARQLDRGPLPHGKGPVSREVQAEALTAKGKPHLY